MSTFGTIASRVLAEASLAEYKLTTQFVLDQWLKPRYREVIDFLAFTGINKTTNFAFTTTPVIKFTDNIPNSSGVNATQGSDVLTNISLVGPPDGSQYIRISTDPEWYLVKAITGLSTIQIDTPYASGSKTRASWVIATRFYNVDSSIRWMFLLKNVSRAFNPIELHESKLDEMFPNRIAAPSVPQWWAPQGWNQSTAQRIIEIYPPADTTYRLEMTGYSGIAEPTLLVSPLSDIPDRLIAIGALADAMFFKASVVDASQAATIIGLARSHEARFYKLLQDIQKREIIDAPQNRIRLLRQQGWGYHGLYDPIMTAEDEIWNRPPQVG